MPALPGGGLPQARGRVAYAVVRSEDPTIFVGESVEVLARVIALELVAKTPAWQFGSSLNAVRDYLLEQEWAEAIVAWMNATGDVIDIYPDEVVWTESDASEEQTLFEIRLSPIFRDPPTQPA